MEIEREKKKPGPQSGPERLRTNVYLEPDLVEWGKSQDGGLSFLVRRLMQAERKRQEKAKADTE